MTEKPRRLGRSPNLSASSTAAATAYEVKDSTNFKVKNFLEETNDNDNNAATALLNILIDENKSTQKSIALLNRNIHELLVFLLKDKKAKDRERRF